MATSRKSRVRLCATIIASPTVKLFGRELRSHAPRRLYTDAAGNTIHNDTVGEGGEGRGGEGIGGNVSNNSLL